MKRMMNEDLLKTVRLLKKSASKENASIWRDAAERLSKPRSRRAVVNLSRINRYTAEGETVLVPGKVLGSGKLDHPVKVAAYSFSKNAKAKILEAGGEVLSIQDLISKNPKGSNVKLMG
ncbi:50S ribosomal protein L18e [Candidatus Bathyarchaeota archaeon]|nr:50S ribosomal protein L18e [Candidatus Bathyarchaeota archaeon]